MSHAILAGDQILMTGISQAQAKELGARWTDSRAAWSLPATRMNAAAIVDTGIGLPDLRDRLVTPYMPVDDGHDDKRLYPYQRDAVGRLAAAPHGLLVCLSPGLGKTAVAIIAAGIAVPDDQVIVIAPASLLKTWERECEKWTPGATTYIVKGKIDFDAAAQARWIIMSWDKAAREVEALGKGWPLVILDESVLTKSRKSKRFQSMKRLRGRVKRMWLLSGSPTTRYADDLWSQLHLLWPAAFPSYWRFAERYTFVEDTVWAKVVSGTRTTRNVADDNSDLMLVVSQEDVLDLPEYLFETIDVELGGRQAREYERMRKEFIAELGDGTEVIAANEIARLQKLQQITSYWGGESAKHDALIDLIGEYEGPHLIWTHWKEGGVALADRLNAAGLQATHINGDTDAGWRDIRLEHFKAGDLDALVLSIGVGKFGHTLTQAKTIWWIDKSWNADDVFQAQHRVRRIGLKHSPVVVTLRAPGTVDELVEDNLAGKFEGIAKVTKSRLAELLKGLGR